MPELVNCPKCDRKLKVPDALLGQAVKCPTCAETFTASVSPAVSSRPAPPVEDEPTLPREERSSRRGALVPRARRDEDDEHEDYNEDYDDRPSRRRRRSRYRRDLAPHRGTMVLVMGILALVGVVPFVLGPIAWIMGNNDLQEMRAGRMDPEGEGQTNAGRICGMIATILQIVGLVIGLIFCLFYFVCMVALVGASAGGAAGPGGAGS